MADRPKKPLPPRASDAALDESGRPGGAMRALLDEQKRQVRKRLWVRLAIVFAALLVVVYLAITTFVFNPIEGRTMPFQNLVPRNCDFFVRKVNLAADLPLPATVFTPGREEATVWRTLEEGRLGIPRATVKEALEAVNQLTARLAGTPLDVVRDLVGSEVCFAGRFPDQGGIAASSFGLYLRVSWRVRAAMGLLRYAFAREKLLPQMRVDVRPDGALRVFLDGRDIYLWRSRDLVLVASDEGWLKEAQQLEVDSGEGSFGQGAGFTDDILLLVKERQGARSAPPSHVQFYCNLERWRAAAGAKKAWPDPASPSMGERAIASAFRTDILHEATGILRFENEPRRRIAIDAAFRTDTNHLDEFGKRLHQERATRKLTRKDANLLGEIAPQSAFAIGAAALSGGDIARQLDALLPPEERKMMDDIVRRTQKYQTWRALMEEFNVALGQRVLAIARVNDYEREEKDPKGMGPDPALALVFPQQGPEKVRQLREYFLANKQQFGFEETYNYFLDANRQYQLLEYYTPLMPSTGEVAILPVGGDEKGEVVLSNQAKLIRNIFHTWLDPGTGKGDRRYAEDPLYRDLMAEWGDRKGTSYSHLFLFVNGPLAHKAIRKYVPYWAAEGGLLDPEKMRAERPAVFARILKEKYPQYTPQTVPAKERAEIEALVDAEFEGRAAAAKANLSPELTKKFDAAIEWIGAVPGLFVSVDLDPKSAKLYANVAVE